MAGAAARQAWTVHTTYTLSCAWCRRFKRRDGTWSTERLTLEETALLDPEAGISHGMCPACEQSLMAALKLSPKA